MSAGTPRRHWECTGGSAGLFPWIVSHLMFCYDPVGWRVHASRLDKAPPEHMLF